MMKPVCHIVAGPNGAGKSTFALDYLPEFAGSIEYVNPDLMAQGLSPTDITLSALKAGKLTLKRIRSLIGQGVTFGFETTLSGIGHLRLLADARGEHDGRRHPEVVKVDCITSLLRVGQQLEVSPSGQRRLETK